MLIYLPLALVMFLSAAGRTLGFCGARNSARNLKHGNFMPLAMSTVISANPLLEQDALPKFSSIQPSNLTPAVDELIKKMDIDFAAFESKISEDDYEAQYDDILPELERIQFPLDYAWGIAGHLNGVKNGEELRKAYEENQAKVVTSVTKFSQSRPIYDALSKIEENWENQRPSDEFEAAQKMRALESNLRAMTLGGVGLDGEEKERFNEIKLRLAELATSFGNNVLDATKAFSHTIENAEDVEGVPSTAKAMWANNYMAAMKEEGKEVEVDPDVGPWRVTLDAPSYIAAMSHVPSREVREKVYKAFLTKASEFTAGDDEKKNNVPSIYEILKLKYERAKMLGFKSPADQSLAAKMAPSVESVRDLSNLIKEKALPSAIRELDEITALARSKGGDMYSEENLEKLMPWDTTFWSERLKESKFDLTEEELRPYFALPSVLEGMFGLVERIFKIEVKSADGEAEVWNPDATFYNVYDKESGNHIASFYLDPYSRPADKRGGAWMGVCIGKSDACERDIPVAYLTCNGSPPVEGKPSLMSFREV